MPMQSNEHCSGNLLASPYVQSVRIITFEGYTSRLMFIFCGGHLSRRESRRGCFMELWRRICDMTGGGEDFRPRLRPRQHVGSAPMD